MDFERNFREEMRFNLKCVIAFTVVAGTVFGASVAMIFDHQRDGDAVKWLKKSGATFKFSDGVQGRFSHRDIEVVDLSNVNIRSQDWVQQIERLENLKELYLGRSVSLPSRCGPVVSRALVAANSNRISSTEISIEDPMELTEFCEFASRATKTNIYVGGGVPEDLKVGPFADALLTATLEHISNANDLEISNLPAGIVLTKQMDKGKGDAAQ